LRIRFSLFRQLKARLRASFGIPKKKKKKKNKHSRPLVFAPLRVDPPPAGIDPKSLKFPARAGSPTVSILIPSYGQVDHVLYCLQSLAAAPPRGSFEIIVAEDASGDPKVARLREVEGVALIENPTNLGFLLSCNAAAATARGKYLFLLNNDTFVHKGAIDDLVDFAEATADCGLVGARLLYPDGYQQEAGGIVWSDGSAWNYGRLDDPSKPQYSYVREVDYVSGAAILTPLETWRRLGGFDPIFAPAYCEDSDYAFRVRGLGLKVYYLPTAIVTHFEGVSHGTDVKSGVKAYQIRNSRKIAERYGELLARDHYPNGETLIRARDRSKGKRVVLIVDHYTPEPDRDAGSRTMMQLIHTLQSMDCVVKFWPENGSHSATYTPPLQRMGVEVFYGPHANALDPWLKENGAEIDFVVLSRPRVAEQALDAVRQFTRATVLYYGHDLHFARQRREAEVMNKPDKALGAIALFETERALWRNADATLYLSQSEIDEVLKWEPDSAAFAVPAYGFDRFAHREHATPGAKVIFVAGFAHPPNVDGAIWLVKEIWPLVLRERPDASLSLIGSNPTPEVLALATENVEVTGWISDEDLARRYEGARAAVVPLRFGAGVKLKVVEAMKEGAPLVTTPIGAQGLPGLAEVVSVRETPKDLAGQVLRWLNATDEAWLAASHGEAAYAEARFGRGAMRAPLEKAMQAGAAIRAARDGASRVAPTAEVSGAPSSP
jgi:GT2 family glycosyltransferase